MSSVGGEQYDSFVEAGGHSLPLVLSHTPGQLQFCMTLAGVEELAVLQGCCAVLATGAHVQPLAVEPPVVVAVEEQVRAVVWQAGQRHYYEAEWDCGDCQPADRHILELNMLMITHTL